MNKKISLLLILLFVSSLAFSQGKHSIAADKLYESGYYTSAINKYKKAYSKAKKNKAERARIASRLGDCYCMTNKTKKVTYTFRLKWYNIKMR